MRECHVRVKKEEETSRTATTEVRNVPLEGVNEERASHNRETSLPRSGIDEIPTPSDIDEARPTEEINPNPLEGADGGEEASDTEHNSQWRTQEFTFDPVPKDNSLPISSTDEPPIPSSSDEEEKHRCQQCNKVVSEGGLPGKVEHVGLEHVASYLQCPVEECDFQVTDFSVKALPMLGKHLNDSHGGLSKLVDKQVEFYHEKTSEMSRVQIKIANQCFPVLFKLDDD